MVALSRSGHVSSISSLTSSLLFRTPLGCDVSLADSTRSNAPIAPPSARTSLATAARSGTVVLLRWELVVEGQDAERRPTLWLTFL